MKKRRAEIPFDNVRRQRAWATDTLKRATAAIGDRAEVIELLVTVGLRRVRDERDERREVRVTAKSDRKLAQLITVLEGSRDQLLGPGVERAEALASDIWLPIDEVQQDVRTAAAQLTGLVEHLKLVRKLAARRLRFPGPDWRRAAARLYLETDMTWLALAVLSRAVVKGLPRDDAAFLPVTLVEARHEEGALKEAAAKYGRRPGHT